MKINGFQDTIDWYEQNASTYAQKSHKGSISDTQQLEAFSLQLPDHAKILDVGCGAGRDSEILRKKGFTVLGIDITHKLVEEAKKSYPNCVFQQGDMLKLPFANETFHGVWAHASIVHFDKDEQIEIAFREISRVLKTDGVIHILVRARKKETYQIIKDSIAQHERYYRNFSQKEIRDLSQKNNLKIISINQYEESRIDPNKRPGEGIEWIVVLAQKRRGSKLSP